jgi:hypothetical protein
MTRYLAAVIFVCAGVLSGPALAQQAPPSSAEKACLQPFNFYSFQPVPGNNRSLVVIDRARKRYRLTFMGPCRNLDFHLALRFKTFGGNLTCVSRGDSVTVRDVASPGQQCIIKSVDFQTPVQDKLDADTAAAKH